MMSCIVQQTKKLSLSQNLTRLAGRLRDPEWRRYGTILLTGKLAGVASALAIMAVVSDLFFTHVLAADTPALKAADVVNPVNTAWTLVAAFLVFGMQVG